MRHGGGGRLKGSERGGRDVTERAVRNNRLSGVDGGGVVAVVGGEVLWLGWARLRGWGGLQVAR